ncbi:MAG TPA: cysteine synthase CysM [Saprospiraceae bacterium]|nr:cysteine synthase CysM [Saprospiraceae bacterium]
MTFHNVLELIGHTPIVQLQGVTDNPDIQLYAKLEGQNPGGSVKDRAALSMLEGALQRGDIQPGSHVVEATSGNTGIALAMIARQFDVKMTLVMPDHATQERIDTMRAFGAEVVLTPSEKSIEYSRVYAENLVTEKGYYLLNQFANVDNWRGHYKTTGPEIWKATGGRVTHFVSAMGTTGTIMGVSRYLKGKVDEIQIIGAQPTEGSSIPGIRRWSPEFVPAIFDPHRVDRTMDVSREEAIASMKELAQKYSIFTGLSAGGAFAVAKKVVGEIEKGVVVFICPDRGDRYLSSGVFQSS